MPEMRKRIALVGNGPISKADRKQISQFPSVVRFNDAKNYQQWERTTHLTLRANSTGVNAVDQQGQITAPINFKELRHLYLIGKIEPLLRQRIESNYQHLNLHFFGTESSESGKTFTTGTHMIRHFAKTGQFDIHVYGMNWSGSSQWHNFDLEKRLINEWVAAKKLTVHSTPKDSYFP
jgi:hypothetical protein